MAFCSPFQISRHPFTDASTFEQMGYIRLVLFWWLLVLAGSAARSQVAFSVDTDLCQHEPWRLVFHDEFDGNSLDLTKWIPYNPVWDEARGDYYETPPLSNPDAALTMVRADDYRSFYSPDNIAVSNGTCNITFKYQPQNIYGGSATFTTGKLFHKLPFESGRFDIRCRIPRKGGVWAAFWMMGVNPCTHPYPGGGEIDCFEYAPCESDLETVSTTITGYKRFGCSGPEPSSGEHYTVGNVNIWHVYSSEWDRNVIRFYVDGDLKITQSRYMNGSEGSDCNPGMSLSNGHWIERDGVFPYYSSEHNQSLMAELKCTKDLYTYDLMGICTPSLRSHDYIDKHLDEHVWTIDYIRVYQRANNIQYSLHDLCPKIAGPNIVCNNYN